MAFNYYTIDSIKEIDASNIPERFIKYFQNLSEEMKKEIFDVRPDLAEAIGRTDAGNGDETVKKETIDNSTDIIAERKAEELTERDLSEEELQIIDKWEDISIRSWKSARVTAPVLVCKIMPDHQRMCPIHRRNLVKKQIRLEQGHYNLVGYLCPDCMDFFLEEKEIYPVAEALERRNIDAWIQPLEMTLQEWKENTFPLEFTEDIIYIPDTWIEGNMACPIHKNVLVEDTYRKTYKDRSVVFQACRCEECNKLLMRNSKAQELEMECGEIGIPPIEFKRLRLVEKKDKLLKIKPDYFVQNGMMSSYDYDEEADWDILTEKDIVVVSYSRTCTNEGHDAEDILGLVTVCEKKAGIKHYLILMGYCSECERYYMDQDDYMLIYKKGRPELTIYNDTDSNFYITSGKTYDTEKEHLDKLEGDFDKRISEIRNTKGFVGKYQTGDYDDGNLSFAKYRSQDLQKEIERISEYVEKPYGYRTDITLGESGKTFYLGPQDIEVNGEKKVWSFNSDFGKKLVNYRTLELFVNGLQYKVKRRRQFDIADARLYGYTEQSDADAIFRSGITDQFLVNVLNMRKRQHQLIDIISTIQENQNAIVDVALKKNIIVQGCAGSGKTMVLLHRLSSLKYKYPEFDFRKAVILTPNNNFNTHIQGLATSLQLGYVQRFSVEDYYGMLLARYDVSFKLKNKISDEMNVDQEYVDYMYSTDFLEVIKKFYRIELQNIRNLYEEVNSLSCEFGRSAISIPEEDCKLIESLKSELDILNRVVAGNEKDYKKQQSRLDVLNKRNEELQKKIPEAEKNLRDVIVTKFVAVKEEIKRAVEQCLTDIADAEKDIRLFTAEYRKIEKSRVVLQKEKKLAEFQMDIDKAKERYDYLKGRTAELYRFLDCNITILNFAEQINFFKAASPYIKDGGDNERFIRRNVDIVNSYKTEYSELQGKISTLEEEIRKMEGSLYSTDVRNKVHEMNEEIQALNPKVIYDRVYSSASQEVNGYLKKSSGNIRGTHRYDLYLQLHFAAWYFQKYMGDNTFLCIDEGQDLTVDELRLIQKMNGGTPIINIYGDTNQLLKPGRGISDWNVLNQLTDYAQKFTLNENYRNTNQITQFCNDTFHMDVALTGVDGKKVNEIIRNRLEEVLAKLQVSEERIAVILPRSVQKQEYLHTEELPSDIRKIVGDELGNGRISVVYVDEVKGVEFDKVFAVPNGMSKNEKYIAFTRALSELTIVVDDNIKEKRTGAVKVQNDTDSGTGKRETAFHSSKNIKFGKVRKKKDRNKKENKEVKDKLKEETRNCTEKCRRCNKMILINQKQYSQFLKMNFQSYYCKQCSEVTYEERKCKVCGHSFIITLGEKAYYDFKWEELPMMCGNCREKVSVKQ